ncbi:MULTISPECIES: ABC transporter permease [unclassified Leucobacter]|uniref:ABC transporter permease n=1 Tax=unclassified Leucobacter TaxID=2621730 RepID=UPI00165E8D2C|nr:MULTISPECIES: ABC transporter permease [unclassified Leucobacter]MBC9928475.1 ABC transporter permease [Leucobacter sp. cx-169]MBC9936724.1 ABC transporter permease [Leucobacter sp. cx-87]
MTYVLKRIAALALVLLISSFIVFSGMYLAPGSPEQFLVQGRTVSPEVLAAIRAQYGLDDPFLLRYWNWLLDALQGDLGRSLVSQQDVTALVASRLPTTLFLATYAALLIAIIGVGLGVLSATRSGIFEKLVVFGSNLGFAVPTFFAALVLMALFGANLGWFPVSGSGEGFVDRIWHLTLPAIALALPGIAIVARITRTAVREEQGSEHVVMAIARGVPKQIVLWRHTIRNSMLPVTTVLGTNIAGLLAAAFVIEYAFTLDGIGSLLVNSVQKKDFAVVQAIALIMVLAFGLINLIVDLLYAVIDPRVRLNKGVSAR